MKLFKDKIRTFEGIIEPLEGIYHYYDRSSRPEMTSVRHLLESWFQNYPDSEKRELKIRFKHNFQDAFYELFIHQLFLKQNFELIPHPKLPDSADRPDFLVTGNGLEFYLEVTDSKELSKQQEGQRKILKSVYGFLNTAKIPNFFLRIIDVELKIGQQPNSRRIVKFLEKETSKYDPDHYAPHFSFDHLPKIEYEDKAIKISFSLIPKLSKYRQSDTEPIAISPIETAWITGDHISSSFKKKHKKYGVLDKPFLLCINDSSKWRITERTVFNVFFGTEFLTIPKVDGNYNPKDARSERKTDGLFYNPKFNFGKISGVLITSVNELDSLNQRHWLIENPNSTLKMDFSKIKMSKILRRHKVMERVQGLSIEEIFKEENSYSG